MTMINGFPIKKIPKTLSITNIGVKSPEGTVLDINDQKIQAKSAAILARKISTLINPVASKGSFLISKVPVDAATKTISLDFKGTYTKGVSFVVISEEIIDSTNFVHREFVKQYLNRNFDELLKENGFSQNGRFFWRKEEDEDRIGSIFIQRKGMFVRTISLDNGAFLLQADYKTELLGAFTVDKMITHLVKKLNVQSWEEIPVNELNAIIYKLGGRLKSTYLLSGENRGRTYPFSRFDLSNNISDKMATGHSLISFHKLRNRHVKNKHQPIIYCKVGNGELPFIPSFLVPSVSLDDVKSINPHYSRQVQKNAKKPISFHYEALVEDYLSDLIEEGVIDLPEEVNAISLAPIILNVGTNRPIRINKDLDFDTFYQRKGLFRKPEFDKIVVITDKQEWAIVQEFLESFLQDLRSFGLEISIEKHLFQTKLKYGGEAYFRELEQFISDVSSNLSHNQLLLIIPPESKHWGELRKQVKKHITTEQDIASQFIKVSNIQNPIDREKRLNNPLILQVIAKMGGIPFIYQFDNLLDDAIFIGIDRSRSWDYKPSVSSAAAVFSNTGEFIFAGTTDLDSRLDDSIRVHNLEHLIRDVVRESLKRKPGMKKIVILRDSGRGKLWYLDEEAEKSVAVASELGLECIFVLCNKSAFWRFFEQDLHIGIQRAEQYTAVLDFGNKTEFIIQTTAPIGFDPTKDKESPRTTTYDIRINTTDIPLPRLKELLARCISAMARMNMRSWRTCRLPTPIHYADMLAHFCGDIGTSWPKNNKRPLFL